MNDFVIYSLCYANVLSSREVVQSSEVVNSSGEQGMWFGFYDFRVADQAKKNKSDCS